LRANGLCPVQLIGCDATENERIIDRHLRDIDPLLDYDASESQSISI